MTASWVDDVWLSVDCETTGLDVYADRIVEIAAVEVHPDGTIGDSYTTIVNPGIEIPDSAAAIHHITTQRAIDEGVAPAVALEEVARRIFAHGHRPVVGFNMRFDWNLLICEAERHHVDFPALAPVLDPFLIDRMMDQYRKGPRKLTAVAQHYAVELDEADAHGALADAVAAARVMRQIVARYPKIAERSLASVFLRQVRGYERWRTGFVDYKHQQGDLQFRIAPGWPIAAELNGGLPVTANPAAGSPGLPPGAVAKGEGVVDAARAEPTPTTPEPTREPRTGPTYGVKDVARLSTEVFRADYDAAPKGHKTRIVERLRHAVVYAQTGGRARSLNDCTIDELIGVDQRLRNIRDGQLVYSHDDTGVTFVTIGGSEVLITWAQIAGAEAAA